MKNLFVQTFFFVLFRHLKNRRRALRYKDTLLSPRLDDRALFMRRNYLLWIPFIILFWANNPARETWVKNNSDSSFWALSWRSWALLLLVYQKTERKSTWYLETNQKLILPWGFRSWRLATRELSWNFHKFSLSSTIFSKIIHWKFLFFLAQCLRNCTST